MTKIKIVKVLNKLAKNGTTKLCSIKTLDKLGQEVWIGGFGNKTTESWQDGQEVELELYQEEYNGKVSWKFKPPVEVNIVEVLKRIEDKLDQLLSSKTSVSQPITGSGVEQQGEEIYVDGKKIPF
jgi:hypothetical protein